MPPILSAHEIGNGLPILIIHGWQMSREVEQFDFEPVFSQIEGLRRIYVDLPGMGRTAAQGVQDLDGVLEGLVGFVEERLGIESRFLVVGTSCGAYLARAVVARFAGRVDGLVLRVPLVEPEDRLRDLDVFDGEEEGVLVRGKEVMASLGGEDRNVLGNVLVQTEMYVGALKRKYEEAYLPAGRVAHKEVLEPIRADPALYRLSKVGGMESEKFFAPTLVLCGRHDEIVGYRDSLRLLELYPRSTFVVLDRGTHALPVDESGLFGALVRDWIFRVHEWRNRGQT